MEVEGINVVLGDWPSFKRTNTALNAIFTLLATKLSAFFGIFY